VEGGCRLIPRPCGNEASVGGEGGEGGEGGVWRRVEYKGEARVLFLQLVYYCSCLTQQLASPDSSTTRTIIHNPVISTPTGETLLQHNRGKTNENATVNARCIHSKVDCL